MTHARTSALALWLATAVRTSGRRRSPWIALCLVVVAASSACTQPPTTADQLDANKKLLLDFFASQEPRAARAERFMAEDYIQHNPRALRMDEITGARGRQAWVRAFEEAESRGARLVDLGGIALRDPVLVMAEGDLVTAIYRGTLPDPDDESRTYEAFAFETVRIKDGKFVEHWDQVTLAAGWMDGQR